MQVLQSFGHTEKSVEEHIGSDDMLKQRMKHCRYWWCLDREDEDIVSDWCNGGN